MPPPPGDFGQPDSKRLPPHHVPSERSVLGGILVQNEAIDRVLDVGLLPQDFYRDQHRKIYEGCLWLNERREPIDIVTLSSALRDKGWFDSVGGTESLTSLFDDSFAVGNIEHYAQIVRDKAIQRQIIEACQAVSKTGYDGVGDTEEFVNLAETKVFAAAERSVAGKLIPLKSILMENVAAVEELSNRSEDVTGLATGFTDFDRITTGLHPGQVVIVAARPGMGKTSWFISALQHAALSQDKVAALFSLEMSKEEMGFRFLSGLARIDARKLKTGRLSDRDWQKLAEAADVLSKSKIMIDDTGGMTVMDIRARCRRLKAIEKRLDIIVVDYLQLMRGMRTTKGGDQSREREISEISRNLKELAKELKVPIIALSQLNRGVEQRQDKRPNLSDLRESGAIEQDADIVTFIHREDYYDKESENRGIAEFIVAKNRSGETDTVRLAWLAQYTLFANLSSEEGTPVYSARPDKGDITL